MKKLNTLFIGFLLSISFFSFAQNAGIKGFIYDKSTGEPVMYATVAVKELGKGAVTDVNGYYVINKLKAGHYNLQITSIGYDTIRESITLGKKQLLSKNYYLKEQSVKLKTVYVSAERQAARTDTKVSVAKVTPQQIKQIPMIGGQPDLAQYLQVLPGVIFTGDQGGQLYIRGGSPIQNKVLLDGMVVYNPFHSIGLFSVFDTDIIQNADIYTGAFGAEYGGRISSIMDITTKDGNKKRLSGKIGASTFGANAMLEGPLKKQTENDQGSSSFLLSVKNSYLKESSKSLYNYIDKNGLPFNFLDIYGKASVNWGNGSKINFFGFRFDDKVTNYHSLANFNWKAFGGGSRFVIIPGQTSTLISGHVSYSSYKIQLDEAGNTPRTSSINDFNIGLDLSYFFGENNLRYGVEMLGFTTDYLFFNAARRKIQDHQNTTEFGAYVKYKWIKNNWIVEPGLRLQLYASQSTTTIEPRLAVKYKLNDNIRLKLATGMYSQNLISATSDRDVVNLFYGFLAGPESVPDKFRGKDINNKLQKAEHIIAGIEIDLNKALTLNLETYYKNFSQLTNLNTNKIYNSTTENVPEELKMDFIVEEGNAKGVDVSLKYDYDRWFIWAVYSLGFVERSDAFITYYPHFDRRHNINLLGSVKLGEAYDWELSIRYNFGSGFPFTPLAGNYEQVSISSDISTNYIIQNGNMGFLFGKRGSHRLPNYHRVDISAKKIFEIGNNSTLEATAGITNTLNRENIFYVNLYEHKTVYQLPFMPSLGVVFKF